MSNKKPTVREILDKLPIPPKKTAYEKSKLSKYRNCPNCGKLLHYVSIKYYIAVKENRMCVPCTNKHRMMVMKANGVEYDGRIPYQWKKGNRNGSTLWNDEKKPNKPKEE
tara:strand:- start:462 stop:791 length:330 start_codon:yes stop_codon:yes gene_type:complete